MLCAAWETGDAWSSYRQLEKLAEGLFHRPVALFFLPEPPEEPERHLSDSIVILRRRPAPDRLACTGGSGR